jgi:hypothetical protein
MDGFDHGDYWKNAESVKEIARVVGTHVTEPFAEAAGEKENDRLSMRADTLATHALEELEHIPPDLLVKWLARPLE